MNARDMRKVSCCTIILQNKFVFSYPNGPKGSTEAREEKIGRWGERARREGYVHNIQKKMRETNLFLVFTFSFSSTLIVHCFFHG